MIDYLSHSEEFSESEYPLLPSRFTYLSLYNFHCRNGFFCIPKSWKELSTSKTVEALTSRCNLRYPCYLVCFEILLTIGEVNPEMRNGYFEGMYILITICNCRN